MWYWMTFFDFIISESKGRSVSYSYDLWLFILLSVSIILNLLIPNSNKKNSYHVYPSSFTVFWGGATNNCPNHSNGNGLSHPSQQLICTQPAILAVAASPRVPPNPRNMLVSLFFVSGGWWWQFSAKEQCQSCKN